MGKNEREIMYIEETSTLVGTKRRRLMDEATGEVMEVDQITKLRYDTKHFWKCYMNKFLKVMKSLSGRQFHVFVYIVENTKPSDNLFIGTYDRIVEGSECSRQTVAAAMKKLQEANFIRKMQNGVWMVNPDILMKGNDKKRRMLLSEYTKAIPKGDGRGKNNRQRTGFA